MSSAMTSKVYVSNKQLLSLVGLSIIQLAVLLSPRHEELVFIGQQALSKSTSKAFKTYWNF